MGFLKAHFTEYFMITELNMVIGNEVKTKEYIDEARLYNLKIYGIDINVSEDEYILKDGKIVVPLTVIKNLGKEAVTHILTEREKGKFEDYFDFLRRIYSSKTNVRVLENLILCGALDSFGLNRKTMIDNLEICLDYAILCTKIDESLVEKPEIIIKEEFTENELLQYEYEIFGFYIKNHPVTKYRRDNMCHLKDANKYFDKVINVVALIDLLKETQTKNKDKMAFLTVSDENAKLTVVVFPNTYKMCFGIKKGDIIKITGRVIKKITLQILFNFEKCKCKKVKICIVKIKF